MLHSHHKRAIRIILQICIGLLVAWGIARSIQDSTLQLRARYVELTAEMAELEKRAVETSAPDEVKQLKAAVERLDRQVQHFWRADYRWLVAASAAYACGMLPAAFYWRRCLLAMGQHAPTIDVLWAYFYGNLGKYFPGKAMVIVLRLAALSPFGVRRVVTSITIFMETLTMMAVGGALAAICLIMLNLDWKLTSLAIGLLLVTFVPTFPPLLRLLLPKLQSGVEASTLSAWTNRLDWRLTIEGWGTLALTWLGFGLSLGLVLAGLPIAEGSAANLTDYWLSVYGACALAVVLGFVSLIPGGAGVREVVLSAVLAPIVGPTAALCCAIWLRVTWLATELLMVGLFYFFRQGPGSPPANELPQADMSQQVGSTDEFNGSVS